MIEQIKESNQISSKEIDIPKKVEQEHIPHLQQQLPHQNNSNENQPKWKISFTQQFHKLGFPDCKTIHCKHKYGCIQSVLNASLRLLCIGYLIKSGMTLVFGLKKLFSNPKFILKVILSKDSLNFGFFLGSFVGLFRGLMCLMRRYIPEQKHQFIPFIAGLFAGTFSVLFLEKKSRQTYALFLLARAIDISYNNLVKKGILPEFKYFYVVLYSLMMAITGYAFGNEPGSMSPEMNKFYLTFTNETLSDMQMRQIWIQRKNNELALKGIVPQNPLDYMPKLRKYLQRNK